jgi:cytochrome c biogenesis protein CcmG/thiol:disulfide interchange protein DsbE
MIGLVSTPGLRADDPALKVGESFPDLGGFQLEGKLPAELKDKVLLVDFWASWCEPCRQSFPVMDDLLTKYGPRGLVIVAVSVDEKDSDMQKFLKKMKPSFMVVRDASAKLVAKVGVPTMPTSFLIDQQGKVRNIHTGFRGEKTRKEYEQEIEALLKK